jgi:hypothetical protein
MIQKPPHCDQEICPLNKKFNLLCSDVMEVKEALLGSEKWQRKGMVADVQELKEWRRQITLRVAVVGTGFGAGGSFIAWLVKTILNQ